MNGYVAQRRGRFYAVIYQGRDPVTGKVRHQQIEALYDTLLNPAQGRGLAPKTVYEIHLIIRGSLTDAVRRGLVTRKVALVVQAPKQRSLQKLDGQAWTEEELRRFLRTAAGHRHFPILWLTAMTGMRRNEVLGLKWPDIDFNKQRLALNRGLVAVGYEVHQTRGKTKTAQRNIDLDETTLNVLAGWRAFQAAEFAAVGIDGGDQWVFADGNGNPVRPHAIRESFRRIANNAGVPPLRFDDYADLRVMPTSTRSGWSAGCGAIVCRHNHSASRKARRVSGGR